MTDSIIDKITGYSSPTQLVEHFGSTRKAAEALGTSQRTVQRWLTGQYKPGRKALPKIRAAMPAKKIILNGNVKVAGYERDRTIDFPGYHKEMSEGQWDRLAGLAASGNEQAVWDQMAHDYGVSSMELIIGTIDIE